MKAASMLISACLIASISYGAAYYSIKFNLHYCYSSAIWEIQKDARRLSDKSSSENIKEFITRLEGIPALGYESDCEEVSKYIADEYAK